MSTYTCRAVSLRTGRAGPELPLTAISGQRRVDPGQFSANLMTPSAPPGDVNRDASLKRCQELLSATTPGTQTVIIIRDGQILGEWLLWTRDRRQRPVPLTGLEVISWFHHAAVDGFTKRTNIDELQLAKALVEHALAKPLAPAMTVADPGASGNIVPKGDYPTGSDYVGNIVDQLGAGLDGFDWWVDTDWDTTSAYAQVRRTVRFSHPRRGRLLQARIDVPASGAGASGVAAGVLEDATRLATTVYMTGTGEGDTQLVARGLNTDLFVSYPPLDFIDSRSSYDVQYLLNTQAAAVAAASRSPEFPTTVDVRAEGDFPLGSYAPGDTVPLTIEATENFPDGVRDVVRIVGYTISPPAEGGTEIVPVEIQRGDIGAFTA